MALSAAEVLSAEVFNGWKTLTGLEIVEGLGSTEALHIYLSNRPGNTKLGAAGLRVPGYEIALKDRDGREVGDNEEGLCGSAAIPIRPATGTGPTNRRRRFATGGWIYTGDRFVRDSRRFPFLPRPRRRPDQDLRTMGLPARSRALPCRASRCQGMRGPRRRTAGPAHDAEGGGGDEQGAASMLTASPGSYRIS